MPDKPLLFFPRPADVGRRRLTGGGGGLRRPSAAQQRQRLDARFQQIAQSFQSLQPTVQGLAPEQVIVLETIGDTVEDFAQAAARVPGMEWLAELDLENVAPEHGFVDGKQAEKRLACRLYAVMSNQQAMGRLISLWNDWTADAKKPWTDRDHRGFGPFKGLFESLRDLRRWDVQDRIAATGVVQYLDEMLAHQTTDVRFEVELWCRQDPAARNRAYASLSALVSAAGGQCVVQAALLDILYHGVLVSMPPQSVRDMIDNIRRQQFTELVRCRDVMFFRPFAQARLPASPGQQPSPGLIDRINSKPLPSGDPIVAVFDGLPLEQHVALRDRLLIDDPDDLGRHYQPERQCHGTAISGLVIHGDLSRNEAALRRPVYIRPILSSKTWPTGHVEEVTPDDCLLVDLVHRAVRRLFEREGDSPPVGPQTKIINLSFGNRFQPFDRELSPLAKLLDWLAWKYKVLFLVSAGNHADNIILDTADGPWQDLSDEELVSKTLHAMRDRQFARRPFSPAEAVNVVTIGAIHADDSTPPTADRRVDLLKGRRLPSPVSTVSNGFRRAVKPEVFFPGGRQLYNDRPAPPVGQAEFEIAESIRPPGLQVAAPGQRPLELDRIVFTRGTSNATALASRCCAQIYEHLESLRTEPGGELLESADWAVLLKCLLVHGATWNDNDELLERTFRQTALAGTGNHAQRASLEMARLKAQFLGYGEVMPDRCVVCTDERVTVVGAGSLACDTAHEYRVPLPPALAGQRIRRRLTITLAWLTPLNPRHQNYRQASLWFSPPKSDIGLAAAEVGDDTSHRGTVAHRVFRGQKAVAFAEGEDLVVQVNCTHDAGRPSEAVPYALAVTLEVMQPIGVSIYEQIQERIRSRIVVQTETQ